MFIISTQPVPPPPIITCTWWCHTSTSHAHHCVLPQYQQHCTYYIQCMAYIMSTHSSLCTLRTNCTTTLSRASTPPFPYCTYTVNVSVLTAPCSGGDRAHKVTVGRTVWWQQFYTVCCYLQSKTVVLCALWISYTCTTERHDGIYIFVSVV